MASPPLRRLSMSSVSSSGSSRGSPRLTPLDSSTALILVHDDEDETSPLHFDSDEDDDVDEHTPQFDIPRVSTPPLDPSVVLIYLLVPYLRLGAMFLPHTGTPLKYGLPSLFAFAALAAFAKQILYMLSRYTRTPELEDVILDLCARGRGKERRRTLLRKAIRAGTGSLRLLLASVYLLESVQVLLPLFPNADSNTLRLVLTAVFAIATLPLSLSQSLASKKLVYTAWFSFTTYLAWVLCVIYTYVQGISLPGSGWLRVGTFWQGTLTIAFTFTSFSTLSLYSSLRGSYRPISTTKQSKTRSFKLLSFSSVVLAVILTLPLVIFSANPNVPATLSDPRPPTLIAIPILNAATLLLGIPALVVTTPSLPIPDRIRHATIIPVSKILLLTSITLLSLVPLNIYIVLSDIVLFSALTSNYFLPALLHVIAHFFKRPLAIIMPQGPSTQASGSSQHRSGPDELLLRKERALQKKQFRKRIVWDLGVWVLLLGGGTGFVAAIGRMLGRW